MKIKLRDKKKTISIFNNMLGFSQDQRARLNAGEIIEVKKIRPEAKAFVAEVRKKRKVEDPSTKKETVKKGSEVKNDLNQNKEK